ncbi:hypothetical protein F5890DRAFT_1481499 [Lentinula detonsa]|uniref:Uncharacterized protein n=1 Tax=Lentinula detonsa TaxID=2804962 RepID=A0AA38UXA4_9AGAR|nr:hypothetical protein F5890DRAFT_1481499 [Lentinula detonsa]
MTPLPLFVSTSSLLCQSFLEIPLIIHGHPHDSCSAYIYFCYFVSTSPPFSLSVVGFMWVFGCLYDFVQLFELLLMPFDTVYDPR